MSPRSLSESIRRLIDGFPPEYREGLSPEFSRSNKPKDSFSEVPTTPKNPSSPTDTKQSSSPYNPFEGIGHEVQLGEQKRKYDAENKKRKVQSERERKLRNRSEAILKHLERLGGMRNFAELIGQYMKGVEADEIIWCASYDAATEKPGDVLSRTNMEIDGLSNLFESKGDAERFVTHIWIKIPRLKKSWRGNHRHHFGILIKVDEKGITVNNKRISSVDRLVSVIRTCERTQDYQDLNSSDWEEPYDTGW